MRRRTRMRCKGCETFVSDDDESEKILFCLLYHINVLIHSFDGELLELDDTPKNQEMEGDEIIDFKMK